MLADACAKISMSMMVCHRRFALMNEVGLSADCATELGHLLDSTPAQMAMLTPAQGNWGAYNQRQTAR
jgi:hypothetical protein